MSISGHVWSRFVRIDLLLAGGRRVRARFVRSNSISNNPTLLVRTHLRDICEFFVENECSTEHVALYNHTFYLHLFHSAQDFRELSSMREVAAYLIELPSQLF